ncbi:MAG: hypothetical protein J3Q66DRAFT_342135 [Benniella sp.]|nr:MAG: hypothetical protein J3Q66DRAFT_342135 [Benniella sp.]
MYFQASSTSLVSVEQIRYTHLFSSILVAVPLLLLSVSPPPSLCYNMVSKFFALTLVAAVASQVNAYYWHVETFYQRFGEETSLFYNVHPVDIQIPGNTEAVVAWGGIVLDDNPYTVTIHFNEHGYENVYLDMDHSTQELTALRAMDNKLQEKAVFSCVKMDEFLSEELYNREVTKKVYSCGNRAYFGRKGIPVPTTTTRAVPTTTTTVAVPTTTTLPPAIVTTTNTNVVTTTTVPTTTRTTTTAIVATTIVTSVATEPIITTTTLVPKPTPTCLAGYRGKRNGKGPNGACCSHSDDCKDTCVKGVCGLSP